MLHRVNKSCIILYILIFVSSCKSNRIVASIKDNQDDLILLSDKYFYEHQLETEYGRSQIHYCQYIDHENDGKNYELLEIFSDTACVHIFYDEMLYKSNVDSLVLYEFYSNRSPIFGKTFWVAIDIGRTSRDLPIELLPFFHKKRKRISDKIYYYISNDLVSLLDDL